MDAVLAQVLQCMLQRLCINKSRLQCERCVVGNNWQEQVGVMLPGTGVTSSSADSIGLTEVSNVQVLTRECCSGGASDTALGQGVPRPILLSRLDGTEIRDVS